MLNEIPMRFLILILYVRFPGIIIISHTLTDTAGIECAVSKSKSGAGRIALRKSPSRPSTKDSGKALAESDPESMRLPAAPRAAASERCQGQKIHTLSGNCWFDRHGISSAGHVLKNPIAIPFRIGYACDSTYDIFCNMLWYFCSQTTGMIDD